MTAGGLMCVEPAAQVGMLPIVVLPAGFVSHYKCFPLILNVVHVVGGQDGAETSAAMVVYIVLPNQSKTIVEC